MEIRKKILVAEDDETNYLYMQTLLEIEGYQILRAANGREAIHAVKVDPDISLVLMDIRMPDVNGYVAAAEIKSLRPELPIVAQTAYALTDDKEKVVQAGCDDYLAKPIMKDDLLAMVTKYI
jgi:CheY-like chemotaxis protein